MDGYIGQILLWAPNIVPVNWMACEGQVLNIQQNAALYSILGINYGGNGTSTFQLPDLRGATLNGVKGGGGVGAKSGAATVTLTVANMPAHTHAWNGVTDPGNQQSAAGGLVANTGATDPDYATSGTTVALAAGTIANAGSGQPISVMQPSLGVRYIICVRGLYPQRS
jgi:microcystin-dependent protein